ncbi:shikimate dehydrogenase [Pelobium manganitolerans]|uniref:Shikimate dehydrogenase n=1 Tax=Pelobium manganitolerans TaxID=1842495 RepID=A0A419SBE4_9SPHI|nr:shikimate dehydrogenase [Pelobium manganitolerans]RKD20141.1 shikimate dehydrogenase [Pelobium manganitolerans]
MKKYGLIGFPLGHSFSEKYFTEKFEKAKLKNFKYSLFPLENIQDFPKLLATERDLYGINVTIPHKVEVLQFLDDIDPAAKEIGAVNCIKILHGDTVKSLFSGELCMLNPKKYKLVGYNTDAYGFEGSIAPYLKNHHKKALILGNGGAARAIKYVLKKRKIAFKFVSRRPDKDMFSYEELNEQIIKDHQVIINTSPVGTYPNADECPAIPYQYLTDKHLLYDLVYNPQETLFLQKGKAQGASIKNGYQMLELQAEKSWEIWQS